MNDVAVVFPTCNEVRANAAALKWVAQGYDVFCYLNHDTPRIEHAHCIWGTYPGYYTACNVLCQIAGSKYGAIVCAGDDMDPDPAKTASEILSECLTLYGSLWVMQPVGDNIPGVYTIAGSPWLSQEWRQRAYGGKYALPGWYFHQFGDNELLEVATQLGVFYQRPDICQYHHHWIRPGTDIKKTDYQERFNLYWNQDKGIYLTRRAAGWPESELI